MDAHEEYARRRAKKEDVEVDTLWEWIKSIADVIKRRIRRLKHSVDTRHESIFGYPDVVRDLSRLHDIFFPLSQKTKHPTTIHLSVRDITSASL